MNDIGEKIKNYRQLNEMSQLDLELEVGLAPGSLSRIESGKVNPTKETILKIIEVLNLSGEESASLFNIKITNDFEKFVLADKEINSANNIHELTSVVVNKLLNVVKVNYASFWLVDKDNTKLQLVDVHITKQVFIFAQKIIAKKFEEVSISLIEKNTETNHIRKAYESNTTTITHDFFDVAYPIVKNRNISAIFQKLLEAKIIVHMPFTFEGKKLGVIGFIWPKDSISETEILQMKLFVSQISKALYELINKNE